jgi:DNA polymerase V
VSIRPSRHGDFMLRGGSAEAILPVATNDTLKLLKVAHGLTEQLFEAGVPYKKAGVTISALEASGSGQKTMFSGSITKNDKLLAAVDALNKRADREVVVLGSRLKTNAWQTRIDERSPAYTTKWADVSTVRTA